MITKRVGVFPILAIVAIGCSGGRVVRDSDGNAYVAKVMSDGRTWTTENLRLALPGSYCHSDAASECLRFGRLYTWASAAEACGRLGTGWRLPTDNEWRQLAKAYGGTLGDSDGRAAFAGLLAGGPSGFNANKRTRPAIGIAQCAAVGLRQLAPFIVSWQSPSGSQPTARLRCRCPRIQTAKARTLGVRRRCGNRNQVKRDASSRSSTFVHLT